MAMRFSKRAIAGRCPRPQLKVNLATGLRPLRFYTTTLVRPWGWGGSILLAIPGCSCNVRAIKPMGNPETDGSRSGMASCFQTTHWTVVLAAGQDDSTEAASALENLCRTYWYPLYAYA